MMHLFFLAPDFKKPLKLAVDAGGVGARDVLLQHDDNGVARTFVLFPQKNDLYSIPPLKGKLLDSFWP